MSFDCEFVIKLRVDDVDSRDDAEDFLRTFFDSADSIGRYEFVLASESRWHEPEDTTKDTEV